MYTPPTERVTEFTALGDSYTAGIGSDGPCDDLKTPICRRFSKAWPLQLQQNRLWMDFNGKIPKINFLACTSATMGTLRRDQLPKNNPEAYNKFGKPQLAVLTISGNDAGFRDGLIDCVYKFPASMECNERLKRISQKISSGPFKSALKETLYQVIATGREAGGASPSNSFQVFVAGYVPFWNEEDTGCDNVSWAIVPWMYQPLTTDIRKGMNNLVGDLNNVIHSVADELRSLGVFYVDGFQDSFIGHRFCEPGPKSGLEEPTGAETWFWHFKSPYECNGMRPNGSAYDARQENTPSEAELMDQSSILESKELSYFENPFRLQEAVSFLADKPQPDPVDNTDTEKMYMVDRVFHPKGAGYKQYSDKFIESIRAHRVYSCKLNTSGPA